MTQYLNPIEDDIHGKIFSNSFYSMMFFFQTNMHLLIAVPYSVLHYILGIVLMALPIRSPCIAFETLDSSQIDQLFEYNMGLSDTGNIENRASAAFVLSQGSH